MSDLHAITEYLRRSYVEADGLPFMKADEALPQGVCGGGQA